MYTVYLTTNTVNEKQYVGQTNNFKQRQRDWRCLKARYSNYLIQEDRAKYGIDSFTTQVLAEVDSEEDALKLEEHYINELNTLYPQGYNIKVGGKNNSGAPKGVPNVKLSKRVLQIDKTTGEVINEWESTNEVERQLGYSHQHISACCLGKRKSSYGFKWQYA